MDKQELFKSVEGLVKMSPGFAGQDPYREELFNLCRQSHEEEGLGITGD